MRSLARDELMRTLGSLITLSIGSQLNFFVRVPVCIISVYTINYIVIQVTTRSLHSIGVTTAVSAPNQLLSGIGRQVVAF